MNKRRRFKAKRRRAWTRARRLGQLEYRVTWTTAYNAAVPANVQRYVDSLSK